MNNNALDGFIIRPVTMEDLPAAVDLYNLHARELYGANDFNLDETRSSWEAPVFHLSEDTLAVFTPAREMIGFVEFWDYQEPHIVYSMGSVVHPDFRGLGIGSLQEQWLCQRAERSLPNAPEDARVVIRQWVSEKDQPAHALLASRGWKYLRNNFWMQIDLSGAVKAPAVPEGITIRSIEGEQDFRDALIASQDAFQDHWGFAPEPFEEVYARWKYLTGHDAHYDPTLWFVAVDGDTIAGVSLCNGHNEGDPRFGWVNTLGVRRAWRKRGLGQALLEHSFAEFTRRGYQRVGLSVDASSLTGAARLYERAGMRVVRQYRLYEKEVRPGKELTRQKLD